MLVYQRVTGKTDDLTSNHEDITSNDWSFEQN